MGDEDADADEQDGGGGGGGGGGDGAQATGNRRKEGSVAGEERQQLAVVSVGEAVAVGSSRSRVSRELGEEGADAERCDALTRSLDPGFVV